MTPDVMPNRGVFKTVRAAAKPMFATRKKPPSALCRLWRDHLVYYALGAATGVTLACVVMFNL